MRNDFYARTVMVVCAVAGCLAGFGINGLLNVQEENGIAKDNTLLREEYDGVFFDGEKKDGLQKTVTPKPTEPTPGTVSVTVTPTISNAEPEPTPKVSEIPKPTGLPSPTKEPEQARVPEKATPTLTPEVIIAPTPTVEITITPITVLQETEVITYPAQIFGQTPVVNREDTYVTYFEFATDLIAVVEKEIQEKELNETALFTRFMLKALFCGIEITELKINEPIPRGQAALAIHLAAEVMDWEGTATSAKAASKYVTDVSGCSSSEKKAIAYLFGQRIASVSQGDGQQFFPKEGLTEQDNAVWMRRLKQLILEK